MIILALLTVVLGIVSLIAVFSFAYTNKNIHTVIYSPANPCNDEVEIRWLLVKYPNACVFVPTSHINNMLSYDNPRVIVQ